MMNDSSVRVHEHGCMHGHHFKTLSWSAILAGALVGVGLSFLLDVFSVAIGLSAFTMTPDGAISLAIGGFIGMLIGGIASMFVSGWVAGFLGYACCHKHNWGILYGFLAWVLALVIAILLASSIAHYIDSYGEFVSNPATVATTTNEHAPALSMTNERVGMTPAGTTETQPKVMVNAVKATHGLATGAFILFLIFIIGALSSAIGGYAGAESRRKCKAKEMTV